MKKLLLIFSCMLLLCTSCDNIKYKELFEITDQFVDNLTYVYESYGITGGLEHTQYTKDGEYKVSPTGRLINVRIEHYADSKEYEELRKALEKHYSDDYRVNEVYRCNGGTLMIDCRN